MIPDAWYFCCNSPGHNAVDVKVFELNKNLRALCAHKQVVALSATRVIARIVW